MMTMQEWMPLAAVGLVAGFLTSQAIKGGGVGVFGDLIVGAIGGVIGPKLFSLAGVHASSPGGTFIFAFVGACATLALFRIVSK